MRAHAVNLNISKTKHPRISLSFLSTSLLCSPEDVIALSSDEVIQALQDSCEEFKVKYYLNQPN